MSSLETFQLTLAQKEYLDLFMNKVSRSFAVVVPCLEEPLRYYMATAYLLCRVIDNIEDCKETYTWKKDRFEVVKRLLRDPALAPKILPTWEKESWPGLTVDQKQLMTLGDGLELWQIFGLIPEEDRSIIRHWTEAMADGMSQLEDPDEPLGLVYHHGVQLLTNENDYDQYCYIVAGTVGHMATELVIQHYGLIEQTALDLIANAEACGRGLQKANIIKDFAADLERGMCYLNDEWLREIDYAPLSLKGAPLAWKQKVLDNAIKDLYDSTEYVLALPYHAKGYRQASLLCLFPAYQTLFLAAKIQDRLFTPEHSIKISHETMAQCMQDSITFAGDNEGILAYRQQVLSDMQAAFQATP